VLPPSPRLLSNLLGIRLKYLTWLMKELGRDSSQFYTLMRIPKGNGKFRKVYKVDGRLRYVQEKLKTYLEETLPSTGTSYAYEQGASVAKAAPRMEGSKVLLSLDIRDHFGAVTMWQVSTVLEKVGFEDAVGFMIARLACITQGKRSFLPQGSVLSPLLSNRVCEHLLDPVLTQAFPDAKITRYSDNLYLAYDDATVNGRDTLSKLREVVRMTTGWRCHKLRVMPYYRQQRGLGVVLNRKANMPRRKYDQLRSLLHNMARDPVAQVARAKQDYGWQYETAEELLASVRCQIAYWRQFLASTKYNKLQALLESAERALNGNSDND
jgi:RNA-directed DNA polymerase